jgi:hypothetical protein
MMDEKTKNEYINILFKASREAGSAPLFEKLIEVLMDDEYRIRVLEVQVRTLTTIVGTPPFSHIAPVIFSGGINERIGEMTKCQSPGYQEDNGRDIYSHLLKNGYDKSDADAIAKELGEISHGR